MVSSGKHFGTLETRPMAKKLELTWDKSRKRWKKKYKGKQYYFNHGKSKSDLEGYRSALAEWFTVRAEVETVHSDYDRAIFQREKMLQWWQKFGVNQEPENWLQLMGLKGPENENHWNEFAESQIENLNCELAELRAEMTKPNPRPLMEVDQSWRFPSDSTYGIQWQERFAQIKVNGSTKATVSKVIKMFLDNKSSQVGMGLSAGRLDNLRCRLERLEASVGSETPINDITADVFLKFFNDVIGLIRDKEFKQGYGSDVMKSARQFIRWAYRQEVLDRLPRNLDSRDLSIKVPKTKIKTFTKEEVFQLLDTATDRNRLYYLLMLNCGFTQIDVSELSPSEVNWKKGEISHKRIKTEEEEEVPTVTYKLWDETFRLLKEHGDQKGERVFLNRNGNPLVSATLKTTGQSRIKRLDHIYPAFNLLRIKLKITKSLKVFRKTGASKLKEKNEYRSLDTLYLGHSPRSIADIHYSKDERFPDDALAWVGEQFGFCTAR
jgi:integrase